MSIGLGIGNSISGKVSGFGVAPAPTFQFGDALSFDGVNDETTMASDINKPALTAGFSISMWVKFYATPSSELILGNSASLYNQLVFVSPTQAYFRTRSAGASITYFNFPAISTGTWYYIAVSLVTTVNELWIDGVKYTGTTHNYDNENITFNQIGFSGTNYGQLVIDELALQSGAGLSQTDVDALYNSGNGALATSVMTPDVYYRFDESEPSATTTDYSGNGNTGTVTGATFVPHTPTYDADAEAYFIAAGISNATEQIAANQLVLDLKGTGSTTNNTDVWSDSYTIYPLSPTSLTAAEYNLKDPTQNITWLNNPTHATTGITGNGTNAYGDTNWNPTTEGVDIYNAGLTYSGEYSQGDYAMGALQASRYMALRNVNSLRMAYIGSGSSSASFANTTRLITTSSRTDKFLNQVYNNGVFQSQNTTSAGSTNAAPNANVFILALSNSGALSAPFAGEIDFAAAHKGLSANQAKDLSDAITTYNTAVRIDPDATAYITAAGITDPTEQAAVFQLVSDLKGTGSTTNNTDLWTGLDAIYPTSPTSLAAAEYNLKDPDTYQITWYNSPTHSSAGVAFNGSNQYGDTGYPPIDGLQDNHSLGTNFSAYSVGNGALIGSRTLSPNLFNGILEYNNRTYYGVNAPFGNSRPGGVTAGYYILNRDSSLVTLYKDTIDISRITLASTGQNTYSYMIGAYSLSGVATFPASGTMNFTHIGASLTANQVTDLYDAITTYNTAVR